MCVESTLYWGLCRLLINMDMSKLFYVVESSGTVLGTFKYLQIIYKKHGSTITIALFKWLDISNHNEFPLQKTRNNAKLKTKSVFFVLFYSFLSKLDSDDTIRQLSLCIKYNTKCDIFWRFFMRKTHILNTFLFTYFQVCRGDFENCYIIARVLNTIFYKNMCFEQKKQ